MKVSLKVYLLVFCGLSILQVNSQTINPALLKGPWKASWIAVPGESLQGYGVYYFRKDIELLTKPPSFIIHVSADNRYKLYVNQTLVSLGPARGDTYYWNYETIDLAPYLSSGKNVISSIVWNEGDDRAEAQISIRTAFIMQGNSPNEEIVNTDTSWTCIRNKAYQPLTGLGYHSYYVAGAGEEIDMKSSIKDWSLENYNHTDWKNAVKIDAGNPKGRYNASNWMLVPTPIPQMELSRQRITVLRDAGGLNIPSSFPAFKTAVIVPANKTVTLLLDQTFLTNAYLSLNFSKGKNAGIRIGYAEALFSKLSATQGTVKANRNEVENKIFAGRRDSIIADGALNNNFTTLAWRTYRYIQLQITTKDESLVIDDIYGTFTGYPFKQNAKLEGGDKEMQQILNIGWRTARLCAAETYMDCPYYEQLEYVGDTRIQALVSFYNSGDDMLVRNALNLTDHSSIAEGVTLSRHPSHSPQIIPTFSLWYIGMLHDYWMYRPDSIFIKDKLQGARNVLAFFSKYQQTNGSLTGTPYWTFVDWVTDKNWEFGQPPKSATGHSAILDMQLMWAYQQAAEMESKLGTSAFAISYKVKAAELKLTIQQKYWDAAKGLYADTEDKNSFSQHANSLAVLTGMVSGNTATAICQKLLNDAALTNCTIYFKYYLHQALVKGGLGDKYLQWLDIWRKNIEMGLTTWAEKSDLVHVRSDCHAWGASPNIEFYRTVLGIDSDAPGFSKIKIEPHLGQIKNISGEIPHPNGKVYTKYVLTNGILDVQISLPQNTSGTFIWKGKIQPLKAGDNKFIM